MNEVYEKLVNCYESIKERVPFTPKVALILGSGLGDYADDIRVEAVLDYHEIEGFPVSTVRDIRADLFSAMWERFRWYACRAECIIMRDIP